MTESSEKPSVLVVDDEAEVADVYALRLRGEYEVETAYGGAEALERVDDDIDVVLLDRRMPDVSGDDVLGAIRNRGLDCRVVMITAVDPDFDIVEMGFDDYVTKPPRRDELLQTIENLLERSEYAEHVRRRRSLARKKTLLESQKTPEELADSDAFAGLEAEIEDLREELDEESEQLADDTAFLATLRDLTGEEDA